MFSRTPASSGSPLRETPKPVGLVLEEAKKLARPSGKTILIHFSASWCSWCKQLETSLHSAELKPLVNAHFVEVKLIVQESPSKKNLENPGAEQFLNEMGGARSGIPFMVFLDKNGKKLADSNVVGPQMNNIGCPATPEEIAAFGEPLKTVAPRMSAGDRAKITGYFTRNAPKARG